MIKNRYKTVSKIVILLIIATVAVAAVSYGKKQKIFAEDDLYR